MENLTTKQNKKKLLLHACCATCSGYPYYYLSENYNVTLFYYNPNIYPEEEYIKRLNDIKRFSESEGFDLIIGKYDYKLWESYVLGLESEPEGGKRCEKCFIFRLKETAETAKLKGFDFFTTTMSVSPHKNFLLLNKTGKNLENYFKISYIESNFKKKDGYKKTLEISKKLNFYRQNYCGCKYSIKKIAEE
jgi:hypothetical protein